MSAINFKIIKEDTKSKARIGVLKTPHGNIETPAFVAVGTQASVKSLTPEQINQTGIQVLIGNTYHLYLEPGSQIVQKAGGIGKFMNWNGPTMTDSGGFQAFSLGVAFGTGVSKIVRGQEELLLSESAEELTTKKNKKSRGEASHLKPAKIDENGVMFRSHLDGTAHYFTPEKSIEIQNALGADIIFAFDECTSPTESFNYQREALDRTHRWAWRSLEAHKKSGKTKEQAIFGIVQGGREEILRKESAEVISQMGFDGFGIGGSFMKEDMSTSVDWVNSILPKEKPRHLLGIGEPADLLMAVENGCDLFDCVLPTRNARTGQVFTKIGKINLTNTKFSDDFTKIEEKCECYTCKNFSRAYLSHLFRAKEMLGATLASIHNLYFLNKLVEEMRVAILEGDFDNYKQKFPMI